MMFIFSFVFFTLVSDARQMFGPQDLLRGPLNKPYTDISRECWRANLWGGYYQREAKKAYDCGGHSTPLSTLFFNKPRFSPQEAFAQSSASVVTNPLLATSILGPRIEYKEKGVMLGVDLQGYVTDCWRMGVRSTLPVGKRQLKRLASRGNGSSSLGGQTTQDVAAERIEIVNGSEIVSYAYRLDFLSRLPYTCADCPARNFLIVNYHDADFPPFDPITISNQDITDLTGNPVSAIRSQNGTVPQGQLALPQAQAQQLPIINSVGNNLPQNGRGRFSQTVNYTALGNSEQNQAELFIVPSVHGSHTTAMSRIIQQQVRELLACISPEAEIVFTDCGMSFDSQCVKGIGNLDTELYGGYFFSECLYGEVFGGIVFPTGRRVNNAQRPFKQAIGNNDHYEFKLGGQALYQPNSWACIKTDLSWYWAQTHDECIAASFVGARIKNIGTPIQASISWDSVLFHADLVIIPRTQFCLGATLGYELYYKSRDVVRFCAPFATDCLGNTQLLDTQVVAKNTSIVSQKIRAELFSNTVEWIQLFGGGSYVFAGKNAPKESQWYIGLSYYF
jgi:hypothetical protein